MSVQEREEERQKSCSSRGLGLAAGAAAVGVGVGAALYYFFNKTAEHPDTDGATTSGWTCEETLSNRHRCNDSSSSSNSDDEHSTVSEHTTSDTSMDEEQTDYDDDDNGDDGDDSFNTMASEESSNTSSNCSNEPQRSIGSLESSIDSDTELDQDRDVTNSSLDVPRSSDRDGTPSPPRRLIQTSLNNLDDSLVNLRNRRQRVSNCHRCNDSSSSSDSDVEYLTADLEYLTVSSEHTTTDNSIHEEQTDDDGDDSFNTMASEESSNTLPNCSNEPQTSLGSIIDASIISLESSIDSDTELYRDWDVTNSSLDVPRSSDRDGTLSLLRQLLIHTSSNNFLGNLLNPRQRVRQRSWTLEECTICCEVILKDQRLRQLACSHNFHAACVEPWLAEHQTCPNCRKHT